MIIVDATSRLLPGVLGGEESTLEESHSNNLLEYPHYTRPPEFRGWRVPDILLSGHHANVARWRRKESIRRTRARRPDLFAKLDLSSKQDQKILRELDEEEWEE
jgi:tRNA (guanine37-N1)-methyltransferase